VTDTSGPRLGTVALLDDPRALLGTWVLRREIEDRRGADSGHLEGTLELAEDGERVRWEETLVWRRDGVAVDVRRGLWLEQHAGQWQVLFEDGRPFHRWSPGAEVVHDCAPDTYRGTVTATDDGWRVVWQVSGPAKDYTMVSDLTR
jgi:hypothetical protein